MNENLEEGRKKERKEEKKVVSKTVKTEQTEFIFNNAEFLSLQIFICGSSLDAQELSPLLPVRSL
jgi:hypothetical protein